MARLRRTRCPLDHTATLEELERVAPSLISEDGNPTPTWCSLSIHRRARTRRDLGGQPPVPVVHPRGADQGVAACSTWSCRRRRSTARRGRVGREPSTPRTRCCGSSRTWPGCPRVRGGVRVRWLRRQPLGADVARETPDVAGIAAGRGLRILAREQAHSSVTNTARIIDCRRRPVRPGRRLHAARTWPRRIAADPDPSTLCAVVATAGTTNAGIVDDLEGIGAAGPVERRSGSTSTRRTAVRALSRPSSAYRQVRRHRARRLDASSIPTNGCSPRSTAPPCCTASRGSPGRAHPGRQLPRLDPRSRDEWNPTDYAYHLTRRARGLAMWFSLAVHGVAPTGPRSRVRSPLARYAAGRIEAAEHLTLALRPELLIVRWFERTGWEAADYDRWAQQLLADQIALVLPSKWQGRPIARLALPAP